jgi:hypothetical protein
MTTTVHVPQDHAADARLLEDFTALSAIGATPAGGVERQAATPEDGAMRAWLTAWLVERGFTVATDRVGNLLGLHEFVPGAPTCWPGPIWTASRAATGSTARTACSPRTPRTGW